MQPVGFCGFIPIFSTPYNMKLLVSETKINSALKTEVMKKSVLIVMNFGVFFVSLNYLEFFK